MLLSLQIENYALIRSTNINFSQGFTSICGETEGRVDDFGKHLGIAKEHQSEGSDDKGYQKESYPNIIEYHKMLLDWFRGQKYKILNKK